MLLTASDREPMPSGLNGATSLAPINGSLEVLFYGVGSVHMVSDKKTENRTETKSRMSLSKPSLVTHFCQSAPSS